MLSVGTTYNIICMLHVCVLRTVHTAFKSHRRQAIQKTDINKQLILLLGVRFFVPFFISHPYHFRCKLSHSTCWVWKCTHSHSPFSRAALTLCDSKWPNYICKKDKFKMRWTWTLNIFFLPLIPTVFVYIFPLTNAKESHVFWYLFPSNMKSQYMVNQQWNCGWNASLCPFVQ